MVRTILKYEFQRTRLALALGAGAAVLFSLVSLGMQYLSLTLGGIMFIIAFVIAFAVPYVTPLYLAVHLYRTTYGRRGYLEHALPVKGQTLVLTKFLYGAAATLLSLNVTAVILAILSVQERKMGPIDEANGFMIAGLWDSIVTTFRESPVATTIGIVVLLLMLVSVWAQYVFAVTVGSEAWINKSGALGPVITMAILYVAMQVLGLIAIMIPPQFNVRTNEWAWGSPLLHMLNGTAMDGDFLPVLAFLGVIVVGAFLLRRAVVSVEQKLELR